MDKYHFGDSKCATDFVLVLETHKVYFKPIVSFFTKTNATFRELRESIKNDKILREVGILLYGHKKDVIEKMNVPIVCKSYMFNLLSLSYKRCILKHEKKKETYLMKDDGKHCPVCGYELKDGNLGCYCGRENCPGRYVDGRAFLTKSQAKNLKHLIINKIISKP